MKLILFFTLIGVFILPNVRAQELSFKDSLRTYNNQRILTNTKGAMTLAGWGMANVVVGGVGYFTAKQDEWKYFHEMNAAWGAVNTGFAIGGIMRARKQAAEKINAGKDFHYFERNKSSYLISVALDVVYVGAGVTLAGYGKSAATNGAAYKGFGESIALQGLFLLAFDNIMFASHQKRSSKWNVLMDELRFTGAGLSFVHTF